MSGYRLYQNGGQVGTSSSVGYIFGGLTCATSYTLGVAAVDGAGNVSGVATVSVTTAACSGGGGSAASLAVSTAGSDSTCVRGDLSKPCLSLNRAFALASCGDLVSVAPGSYASQTITGAKSCTPSTPVKFVPSSGQPVFDDVSIQTSYVWVEGMKVPHSLTATSVGDWDVIAPSPKLPSAVSYVTLKNDEGGRFYIYAEHVDMLGGSYGGFNSCLVGGEDLGNIWQQADSSGNYYASSYVTLDGVTVHDGSDNGNLCSGYSNSGAHVDALQILGGHHITIRNSFFYGCPTSCIIGSGFRTGEDNYLIENNFFQQEAHPGATLNFSYSSNGDPATGANMVIRYNTTNGSIATGCTSGSAGCWNVYGNIVGYANCGAGSSWSYNVIADGSCVGGTNKKGTPSFVGPTGQSSFGSTTIPNFHLAPTDTVAKTPATPTATPAPTTTATHARRWRTDLGAHEVG